MGGFNGRIFFIIFRSSVYLDLYLSGCSVQFKITMLILIEQYIFIKKVIQFIIKASKQLQMRFWKGKHVIQSKSEHNIITVLFVCYSPLHLFKQIFPYVFLNHTELNNFEHGADVLLAYSTTICKSSQIPFLFS